jgi:hypothetical protein
MRRRRRRRPAAQSDGARSRQGAGRRLSRQPPRNAVVSAGPDGLLVVVEAVGKSRTGASSRWKSPIPSGLGVRTTGVSQSPRPAHGRRLAVSTTLKLFPTATVRGSSEPRVKPPARHCRFRRAAAVSTCAHARPPGASAAGSAHRSRARFLRGWRDRLPMHTAAPVADPVRDRRSADATAGRSALVLAHGAERVPRIRWVGTMCGAFRCDPSLRGTSGKRHSRTYRRSASSAQPRQLAAAP